MLVAILTLLGGYLLWRDVRREARLAELRTQFASSVSHELKTPLTSIRMFGDAWIQVSDRGIGIPEKEQSRIFEKFYRVPIPENREIPGTGLGLALVAHIAQAHGGSVHVKSRPGDGSTFSIRLPLKEGGAA